MRIILPAQPTDWAVVGIKGDHIYETTFVEGQKIKECDTINSFWRTKIACNLRLIFMTVYIPFVFGPLMMYTVMQDKWAD